MGEDEEEKKEKKQQEQKTPMGEKQLKQKADGAKSKVSKIKKVINFIKKHPLLAKAIFWVSLAILIIIILTSIIYVIFGKEFDSATVSYDEIRKEIASLKTRYYSETMKKMKTQKILMLHI